MEKQFELDGKKFKIERIGFGLRGVEKWCFVLKQDFNGAWLEENYCFENSARLEDGARALCRLHFGPRKIEGL